MQTSQECTNLFKSLIAASTELGNVAKTKVARVGDKYSYKYAPFDGIVDMLRLTLPKHHLWFTQDVSSDGDKYILETLVLHESGEWLKSSMVMTDTKLSMSSNATQQLGASITYFKRYILSAIFGIATDEDVDGNVDAFQRKQEVKANVKAAKDDTSKRQEQPKTDAERASGARNYVMLDMTNRISHGETPESVLKSYADILKTDVQRSPEHIPDNEIIVLATDLYNHNKKKK